MNAVTAQIVDVREAVVWGERGEVGVRSLLTIGDRAAAGVVFGPLRRAERAPIDEECGRAAASIIGGEKQVAKVIEGDVACPLAGGVLRGERMQLIVLDAKAGNLAGGLAVEGLYLDSRVEDGAVRRVGNPVNMRELRGDAGARQIACGRIPVEGENALVRIGSNEDALAARRSERRGGSESDGSCGGSLKKRAAAQFFHGTCDCRRWHAEGASRSRTSTGRVDSYRCMVKTTLMLVSTSTGWPSSR